jgi:hypothetical protein
VENGDSSRRFGGTTKGRRNGSEAAWTISNAVDRLQCDVQHPHQVRLAGLLGAIQWR